MNLALIVFVVAFIAVFLLRIPIGFGMVMASVFYFVVSPSPAATVDMVASKFISEMSGSFIMIAVPLYIFMAEIMNSGKVTRVIFDFAAGLVGKRRGALAQVNIVNSIIFSGMTGSAIADASGPGNIEMQAMIEEGYPRGFTAAVTAASATEGPIIPPSIPMIIYAMISGTSVGALFMGGIVPGLILGVVMMIYVGFVSIKRNYPTGHRIPAKDFLRTSLRSAPALATVVILLGAIYTGIVTPTEAGAIAATWALIISVFFYRAFGPKEFLEVMKNTVKSIGNLSFMIGAAYTFSYIVAIEQIPVLVANAMLGISSSPWVMLLITNVVFLILGCFLDVSTIQLVFVPIVLPVMMKLGVDPVHFGVVIVLNMMIGLSTPPFGMLLFIVTGLSNAKLKDVIREMVPFIVLFIGVLFLITFVPELVLWIPKMMGYQPGL
ncbi:MAG: permease [Spirochaetes bacterium RBG_13_68_11]|nr:MAG: permease [Spirochaetes bacterium RBG_13_68_11]